MLECYNAYNILWMDLCQYVTRKQLNLNIYNRQ